MRILDCSICIYIYILLGVSKNQVPGTVGESHGSSENFLHEISQGPWFFRRMSLSEN